MRFTFLCKEPPASKGFKVAIIGAGPAGLAATGYLVCQGYSIDVYDKQPAPGGLMSFAIPPWRISRENVDEGVKDLEEKFGVNYILKTKVYAGKPSHEEGDLFVERKVALEELIENYDAVLIATGTWLSRIPKLPGINAKGVYSALEYLYLHRIGEIGLSKEKPPIGRKVVVIGGGYSAVDAAEQALKSGAETHLVYRRTIREAPAGIFEIKRVEREGITFMELASPVEILAENNVVKGVKFQKMRLGPPDETGRPKPEPIPGSEFVIEADLVIFATGERATPPVSCEDREALEKLSIAITKWGTIEVNEIQQTGNPKVFAAGDVVNGPTKVGPAIRSGLYAAKYLDNWLKAKALKLALTPAG